MSLHCWNEHYQRDRSRLAYPDENLVRMLTRSLPHDPETISGLAAIDIGCGSGRHLRLLAEYGIQSITGTDYAPNSLELARDMPHTELINCDNAHIPVPDQSFDIAVAWGSLHYGSKADTARQIMEIFRILRPGALLFGTLRSFRDTHAAGMLHNAEDSASITDIAGAAMCFFTEDELRTLFAPFSSFSYGLMERTPLNERERRISHWYYQAAR
jgi:ubiquinone/menaquinone biosynthesis C-methylase UbiE